MDLMTCKEKKLYTKLYFDHFGLILKNQTSNIVKTVQIAQLCYEQRKAPQAVWKPVWSENCLIKSLLRPFLDNIALRHVALHARMA